MTLPASSTGAGHYDVELVAEFPFIHQTFPLQFPNPYSRRDLARRLELFMPLDDQVRFRMGGSGCAIGPGVIS